MGRVGDGPARESRDHPLLCDTPYKRRDGAGMPVRGDQFVLSPRSHQRTDGYARLTPVLEGLREMP